MSGSEVGDRAVILGASMAGLLSARVLSDHYQQVILVERDPLVDIHDPRKGVPQGHHLHALLQTGRDILESLFPGFAHQVVEAGGIDFDPGVGMVLYLADGYPILAEGHYQVLSTTRPFLESHVRRLVIELPNVALRTSCSFDEFLTDTPTTRVSGVRITDRASGTHEEILADIVVDATGRGSRTPDWCEHAGYGPVAEDRVNIDVGYSTRLYRRESTDPRRMAFVVAPSPPDGSRGGIMTPIEGDRWMLTLAGWSGDHPPKDNEGFVQFAKDLPAPDIFEAISKAEPLSDVRTYRFPSSVRRRYERMRRFPEGLIVIGDAFSSYNPVYGQGMSSSAMQAMELADALRTGGLDDLARRFFKKAAKVIDIPWMVAVGADFNFPATTGHKPFATDLINRYVHRLQMGMNSDVDLGIAFFDVQMLKRRATSLFRPSVVWRVARSVLT